MDLVVLNKCYDNDDDHDMYRVVTLNDMEFKIRL